MTVIGIFVGGEGRRMGGVAKGLLQAPEGGLSLIERLAREAASAAPSAELVLVGAAQAYAQLGLSAVADAPAGIGPLGGLLGLLEHARARRAQQVLALACDLPRLDRALLGRLLNEAPDADALVIEHAGFRNPLIARYAVLPALSAATAVWSRKQRSLQAVLDGLRCVTLAVPLDSTQTDDWDTPSDVGR